MPTKFFVSSAVPALYLVACCLLSTSSAAAQQFVAPTNLKINSSSPQSFSGIIGVADFNGDGRKDILAVDSSATGAQQYAVLLAQSNGSYTPQLTGIALPSNSGAAFPPSNTVQIADVDGDRRQDIVIVTSPGANDHGDPLGPSTLSVYLNNGNGTFRAVAPVTVASDFAGVDLAVDLNKDGKPDLIIDDVSPGTGDAHTFTVWTNEGAGKFKATSTVPATTNVNQHALLAHGDFNGDGYPDLVLYTDNGSQVFLNKKGTGFTAGAAYPAFPTLAVGDLNHDGKLDLVGVGFDGISVHILLGNGDGTFRTGTTFRAAGSISSVNVADVNGDGLADIAVIVGDNGVTGDLVLEVFAGTGTGIVSSSASAFNLGSGQTVLADLNNDGKLDVLLFETTSVAVFPASGTYFVAGNDGRGNFRAPRVNFIASPDTIVTADFNRDGNGDVAVVSNAATSTGKATVVVLTGTGKGYFGPPTHYPIDMPSGTIAAGDVNGDGKIDLVIARDSPGGSSTNLSVLLGNGNGTFQPAKNYTMPGYVQTEATMLGALVLADVNRDGKLDLIGRFGVALGKGDGTFGSPIPLPVSIQHVAAISIATGDFNRDGKLDLALGTEPFDPSEGPGILYILLGDGKGSFTVKGQEQQAKTIFISDVAVADMNGDGKADLVFDSTQTPTPTTAARNLTVRLGNGDGTFQAPINYALTPQNFLHPFTVADFNRDGKPDVFLFGPDAPAGKLPGGELTLLPGIGGGKLSATPQYYSPILERGVVLDVNRDGAPDIIGLTPLGVTRLLNTGSRVPVTR